MAMRKTYYDLPQTVQAHLHALELREFYRKGLQFYYSKSKANKEAMLEQTLRQFYNDSWRPWEEEVKNYLLKQMKEKDRLADLVPYYYIAGIGINKIVRELRIGQAQVYEVINRIEGEEPEMYYKELANVFIGNEYLKSNLDYMLTKTGIFEGMRVKDPIIKNFVKIGEK